MFSSSFTAWLKTRSRVISNVWKSSLWLGIASSTAIRLDMGTVLADDVADLCSIKSFQIVLDCSSVLDDLSTTRLEG